MNGLLEGQAAIITGAAQGIGLAIAERFLSQGACVLLADMDQEKVAEAAKGLGYDDSRVASIGCNVTSNEDVKRAVASCQMAFGRLDTVVNNAGLTRDGYLTKMTEESFDAVVDVSLKGSWLMTRAVAALFREQQRGCIVNMSSLSGKIGNPGQTNYSAAKAGLVGLSKAAAKELGPSGVRVNVVQPGLVRTAMTLAMKPEIFAAKEAEVPLGRAGTPGEVADVVVFLASPLASYVNGAVIEVTGAGDVTPIPNHPRRERHA